MQALKTEMVGTDKIEIFQDTDSESPREWDNLSTFAFFHRNYQNESDIRTSDFASLAEIQEHIKKDLDAICVPVYLYSHSGDTIATTPFSCPWDSGQLGFAFVTRDFARKEFGWKRISASREAYLKKQINNEVETFDQWIKGEVYGYVITDENAETVESCWGYYGMDYCLKEAKSIMGNTQEVA